ncbi:MAG: toll/interleukin-1 receptor domain-containing protein [Fimbriimonas sp.]|nr:toll/interleukin-1 receptor domain-containing protein [Fimbriimonas sp.]
MAHDVIISYSSHDKLIADACCAALEAQRIRCWIAPRDVLAGTEYGESILQAIQASQVMLLVFSEKSNKSTYCKKEVERAVGMGKTIVPFRIEDALPSGAMSFFLGNTHWLDALTPPLELRIDELVAGVGRLLNRTENLPSAATAPEISPSPETEAKRFTKLFADRPDVIAVVEAEASQASESIVAEFERHLLRLEVSVPYSAPGYDLNSEHFNRVLIQIEKRDADSEPGRALVSASRQPGATDEEGRKRWHEYERFIGTTARIRDTLIAMGAEVLPLVCVSFRQMNSGDAHNDCRSGFNHTGWIESELVQVMSRLRDFRALPFIADAVLRHPDGMTGHSSFALAIVRAVQSFGVDRNTVDACFERLAGVSASEILREKRERDRH